MEDTTSQELLALRSKQDEGLISLACLKEFLHACRRCPLSESRKNIVFGAGATDARLVIVGEAPGAQEDEQGTPFVGASGKALSEYLSLAGLDRSQVFIANVLKCRPPSNRNPHAEEIAQCAPFLREQIRTIQPEIILTLGNFATRFILKSEKGISELRGKPVSLGAFTVLPTFHPAAALYDRKKRSAIEEDFNLLKELLADSRR